MFFNLRQYWVHLSLMPFVLAIGQRTRLSDAAVRCQSKNKEGGRCALLLNTHSSQRHHIHILSLILFYQVTGIGFLEEPLSNELSSMIERCLASKSISSLSRTWTHACRLINICSYNWDKNRFPVRLKWI